MCESEVYLIRKGIHKETKGMEKFMDEVTFVNVDGDKITLEKMFGEKKELKGKIVAIDLLNRKILIEKI